MPETVRGNTKLPREFYIQQDALSDKQKISLSNDKNATFRYIYQSVWKSAVDVTFPEPVLLILSYKDVFIICWVQLDTVQSLDILFRLKDQRCVSGLNISRTQMAAMVGLHLFHWGSHFLARRAQELQKKCNFPYLRGHMFCFPVSMKFICGAYVNATSVLRVHAAYYSSFFLLSCLSFLSYPTNLGYIGPFTVI